MEEIIGYLKSIKFTNPNNNYNVITVKLDQKKNESITVVGYFSLPKKDQLLKYSGEYVEDKRYGKQFKVESFEIVLPSSKIAISRFLSSSLFKGIGNKTSEKIIDLLGENCLEIISNNKNSLDNIDIKDEQKDIIYNGLKRFKNLNQAIKLFVGHGISIKFLLKMDALYQQNLFDVVTSNPYILIKDIDGIGFKTVDKLALELGIQEDDPRRIKSLVLYSLKNLCYKTLDTYTTKESLFKESKKLLLSLNVEEFNNAYHSLIMDFDIIEDNLKVYYKDYYYSELGIANLLDPYINGKKECIDKGRNDFEINRIQEDENIIYSEEQKETINNCLNSNIFIITGGPGTGKTTVVNAIIKIYLRLYSNKKVSLVAPTGRASKRMSELSEFPSSTIHRFLKWDMETSKFSFNQDNPIFGNFLVVDEFSMVDSLLFYNLLLATTNYSKILLIGDDKQLEPLSPGNVLKDLIDSKLIPTSNLTINHRQSLNSGIIPLCSDTNKGILNEDNLNKDDVSFIETTNANIRDTILNVTNNLINNGYSQNQIQILSPMYDGAGGINSINDLIRDYFNPSSPTKNEIMIGSTKYRVGDKILQLKNQVDDNVFNGDIGYLETIKNNDETYLLINFDNNIVKYEPSDFQNITHAYAISVHKSQGSEFDVVILITSFEHMIMLKRKLIYTGLSRAKKQLIIIGNKDAFIKGINTIDKKIRKTTLKDRLMGQNEYINGTN